MKDSKVVRAPSHTAGAARKRGGTAGSPRYFEPLLREVERKHFPEAYWRHLESNLGRCEDYWQRRPDASPGAARPKLALADPARHPGPAVAARREGVILAALPGIPADHLTEALSKRHPNGASVASRRLFTINRNGVHVRRNTAPATFVRKRKEGIELMLRDIARLDVRKIRLVDRDDPELLAFTSKQVQLHGRLGAAGENSASSELGQLLEGVMRGRLARAIDIRDERYLGYESQQPGTPGYEPRFIEVDAVAGSIECGALRFFEIKTTRSQSALGKGLQQLQRLRSIVSRSRHVSVGLCLIWIDSGISEHQYERFCRDITPMEWGEMVRRANEPIVRHDLPDVVKLSMAEALDWAIEDGALGAQTLWKRALAERQEQQVAPPRRPAGRYATGDAGGIGVFGTELSKALEKAKRG